MQGDPPTENGVDGAFEIQGIAGNQTAVKTDTGADGFEKMAAAADHDLMGPGEVQNRIDDSDDDQDGQNLDIFPVLISEIGEQAQDQEVAKKAEIKDRYGHSAAVLEIESGQGDLAEEEIHNAVAEFVDQDGQVHAHHVR